MKRPQKGDTIKIRSENSSEPVSETIVHVAPSRQSPPYGIEITFISNHFYHPDMPYFLVSDDGVELGASVIHIYESNKPAPRKKIVIFSIIPDSE